MVALLVFIIATLENSFWPKKTVRRKKVRLVIMSSKIRLDNYIIRKFRFFLEDYL